MQTIEIFGAGRQLPEGKQILAGLTFKEQRTRGRKLILCLAIDRNSRMWPDSGTQ